MDSLQFAKDHVKHTVLISLMYVFVALVAVSLDLLSSKLKVFGITSFTATALEWAAHLLLVIDLIGFTLFVIHSSFEVIKRFWK